MAIKDDIENVQETVINELITENGITNTLADGQVTETKIDNGAVTAAKLSNSTLSWNHGTLTIGKAEYEGDDNAGLEINYDLSSGETGTAYIDFHSTGATSPDFDGRIQHADDEFTFMVNDGTELLKLTNDGNLLMDTTNYDVSFSSTDTGISMQPAAQVHLSSNGTALILNHPNNITGTIQQIRYNGSIVGTISNTSSSTSYNTTSDYRLKENVVNLTGATERLKQLEPKRFNFIADADTTVDGFLAHEVQDIVPEAITGTKDEVDADGNPEYQGIDQSKLVPLLVATIKELEARITTLEQQ